MKIIKRDGSEVPYHLLSGTDLPIKSRGYIEEFFENNQGKEFIHFDTDTRLAADKELGRRAKLYHWFQNYRRRYTPNPLYEQVCGGVNLFNKEQCELIVAIGGGSTIDVAKCIKLYCKMDSRINYLKQETFDSGITLIAVPTTAGTGSESTRHAVIYYEGVKQSISHTSIIPDYAVLEPSVLKTLPVYQKKCTMLDALCQAMTEK